MRSSASRPSARGSRRSSASWPSTGRGRGGSTTKRRSPAAPPRFDRPPPPLGERDLLSINYTSGTTARPKGVMITHRNAWTNVVGTLLHHPMSVEDRYLWTLPMFHANGWTFVWTVTAAGATHICLPKVEPVGRLRPRRARVRDDAVRGADRADRHRRRARELAPRRAAGRPRHDRRSAAGGGHDRARRGRARLDDHAGLRPDRDLALHHDLRAAAGARRTRPCRPRRRQGEAGRRAPDLGRAARRGRGGPRGAARRDRRSARSWPAATS